MRALVAVLLASAAFAGCLEERAHLEGLPSSTAGPAGTGGAGGAAGAQPAPERIPVDVQHTHDHMAPAAVRTFEMPASAGQVAVKAGFRTLPGMPACESNEATIKVVDPSGKVWKDLEGGSTTIGPGSGCGSQAHESNSGWAAGTWRIEFGGRGMAEGYFTAESEA